MKFDSAEWRAERDRRLLEWVGDPWAVRWIVGFGDVCEVWDDLIDGDKTVTDEDIHRVFWALLTEMPLNPFFDRHKHQLVPLLVSGINAWMDANHLERGSPNDRVFAYVLRDWYMELVAFVIFLTRGREALRLVSLEVRRFFTHHETLEEYREKLP